jgi:hypothetical protein
LHGTDFVSLFFISSIYRFTESLHSLEYMSSSAGGRDRRSDEINGRDRRDMKPSRSNSPGPRSGHRTSDRSRSRDVST